MESLNERHIAGEGTPESAWQEGFHTRLLKHSTIAALLADSKAVHILAPHPDDEILACGGIIQQLFQMNVRLQVVAVTDGEASHPGSNRWPAPALAAARTKESELALHMLTKRASRKRLRVPDGDVAAHVFELTEMLVALFGKNDMVIAPWRRDGHPDHEAVGDAGWVASEACGCRFFEVPIWGWHWACPLDDTFPWQRAVSIPLTPDEQRAKISAMQLFRTQTEPAPDTQRPAVLPDFVLKRFQRPFEVLLR